MDSLNHNYSEVNWAVDLPSTITNRNGGLAESYSDEDTSSNSVLEVNFEG